jgi:CheY-like chemotaxis protein
VLAVDDEPDARELTGAMLRQHGAEVMTAESVDEAMLAIGRWKPDVLIVDIAMPKADGFELLRRLARGDGESARIPAIALTAYAREEDRVRGVACGFRHYLTKPVDESALLDAVGDVAPRTSANPS